ncbi:MAG: hypothetical protein Q8P55_02530 [bacterium]|nr:hypothetical protein [bacterium]
MNAYMSKEKAFDFYGGKEMRGEQPGIPKEKPKEEPAPEPRPLPRKPVKQPEQPEQPKPYVPDHPAVPEEEPVKVERAPV